MLPEEHIKEDTHAIAVRGTLCHLSFKAGLLLDQLRKKMEALNPGPNRTLAFPLALSNPRPSLFPLPS